jgi:4-amino-4-deoxychorismate lyase
MTACWVDGVRADSLPADDRGLLYGDGLFETLRCEQGEPCFIELHLRRLAAGCAALALPAPDPELLRFELRRAAAGQAACLLRLTLTRGSSSLRGYAPPVPCTPRRILARYPLPPPFDVDTGIRACHSPVIAGLSPTLAGIKHLNRLENVLARARLAGSGCDEAILATADGELVGGTMSNLFVVLDGRLLTPPVLGSGVRGVMREVVRREAAAGGIEMQERPLRRADLAAASEIFFTNVRLGAWPVVALDDWRGVAPGPMVRALRERIQGLRD